MFGWKKSLDQAVFAAVPGSAHQDGITDTIAALRRLRQDLEKLYGELDLACQGIDMLESRLARTQQFQRTRLDGVTLVPREFNSTDRQR